MSRRTTGIARFVSSKLEKLSFRLDASGARVKSLRSRQRTLRARLFRAKHHGRQRERRTGRACSEKRLRNVKLPTFKNERTNARAKYTRLRLTALSYVSSRALVQGSDAGLEYAGDVERLYKSKLGCPGLVHSRNYRHSCDSRREAGERQEQRERGGDALPMRPGTPVASHRSTDRFDRFSLG